MAQEALAHPGRLRRGAAAAAHQWHADLADVACAIARQLIWRQWSIAGPHRATLMRHEVAVARLQRGGLATDLLAPALAPAARTRSVRHAPSAACLVAACRFSLRVPTRRTRTRAAAIALATIAAAAQQDLRAATRAHQQTGRMVDQLPAPREGSRGRRRSLAPRWTKPSGNATLAWHPLHRRGVGYGAVHAARQEAAAVPAYLSGHAGGSTSSAVFPIDSNRRPQCRPAGRHCGRTAPSATRTISAKAPPRRC